MRWCLFNILWQQLSQAQPSLAIFPGSMSAFGKAAGKGKKSQRDGPAMSAFSSVAEKGQKSRTSRTRTLPKGAAKAEFARRKRALFNAAMDVLLKPLRVYQRTGVLMQLPGRDGDTHTSVVVPCAAMCSYDQPEADLIVGTKVAHRMMPMMCSM